jgi:hypothetical protein
MRALEAAEARFNDATHVAGHSTSFSYGIATVGSGRHNVADAHGGGGQGYVPPEADQAVWGDSLAEALVDDPED